MDELLAFGFSEDICRFALEQGLTTTEERVSWILENSFDNSHPQETSEHKMTIAVRTDLEMSAGKVAAQCVHAALGVIRQCPADRRTLWEQMGEKVVCLRCENLDHLCNVQQRALSTGTACYAVHDAGRTEVAAGSITTVAVGPDEVSKVDSVTGHLRLY